MNEQHCSSVNTMAEYWLFLVVELVTSAEHVPPAGPKSFQSAEPWSGLMEVFAHTCHYLVTIPLLHWKLA